MMYTTEIQMTYLLMLLMGIDILPEYKDIKED